MDEPRESDLLDRLVRAELASAIRFATRLTGDLDQAEEIVQQALLRAVRAWRGFRGESAFRTWLFRIIVNVFRDRPAGSPRVEPIDAIDPRAREPFEAAAATELGEIVAHWVGRLPPRQREVVVLCIHEGMTPAEAAAVLDASPGSVRVQLHEARKWLREKLQGYVEKQR